MLFVLVVFVTNPAVEIQYANGDGFVWRFSMALFTGIESFAFVVK